MELITTPSAIPAIDDVQHARLKAADHIATYYPVWKQLNVLSSGDAVAIATMTTFINAVRSWSNQIPAPMDVTTLQSIVP
jgi:hypothetical protein